MDIYYAICAGLVTVSLTTAMAFLTVTAFEIRKTARTLNRLAVNVDQKVEALRGLSEIVQHFSKAVKSNWMRGAEFAYGVFSGLRERQEREHERRERQEAEHEREEV